MDLKTVSTQSSGDAQLTGVAMPKAELELSGADPDAEQWEAPVDLQRVSDGDPAVWSEIFRRYGKLVSATVRSFRLQDADALDVVQTTWLRLVENIHQIQSSERLAGWLATTARRECLRILRQAKHAPSLTGTMADTVADPSVGPEPRVIEADTAHGLWSLVEDLSPRQRTVLRALFTDRPPSYASVAHTTGIPVGAIGPTRARALSQLRDRLEQPQSSSQILGRLQVRSAAAQGSNQSRLGLAMTASAPAPSLPVLLPN